MNILTFDIEDWYCNCVYTDLDWEKYECRLYEGVDMILEEYDEEKVRDMFRKEYLEEGREQEHHRYTVELAHRMRDRGMDTTMIADLLGLTEEQVETYLAQPVQI